MRARTKQPSSKQRHDRRCAASALGLIATILGVLGALPSWADAQTPNPDIQASYRDTVARAVSEFDAGHVAEARALFLRAHELWPSARTLRTLGMTAFELRLYPRALQELQAALDDPRRPLPEPQRAQVRELIERTNAFVGRYSLHVSPADAELLIDGALLAARTDKLTVAVGEHALLVRAPGYDELRRTLIVQGREDAELVLALEPLSPPTAAGDLASPRAVAFASPSAGPPDERNDVSAFIALGVASAALAVGLVSGSIALSKKHAADPTSGYRAADISTVSFVTAGVGAAVGTVLLLVQPGGAAKRSSAASNQPLHAVAGWGSIGLDAHF